MKIEIDTEKQTIKVLGNVPAYDLLDYIHQHELHEYKIVGHEEEFKYPWPSLPPQEPCNPVDHLITPPPRYGGGTGRPNLDW